MKKRETDYDNEQKNKISVRNDFVKAVHPDKMDLKSMKLFRLVVSQCRERDSELYAYDFKITELAKAIGVDSSNIYKDTENMCLNLMQMVLKYGSGDPSQNWKMKHIFETCEYTSETGTLTIKLHEDMTDLVLRLGGKFTQIPIYSVLMMKSKYAIRLYELICEKMMNNKPHGNVAVAVDLSLDEIRQATGTDKNKTYDIISNLKRKVVLPAIKDIEAATRYRGQENFTGWKIILNNTKKGRRITGFNLEIWTRSGYAVTEQCKREGKLPPVPKYRDEKPEKPMEGQMTIYDLLDDPIAEGGES